MLDTNFTQLLPIVPADILDRFHANEPFDTRFSSCARLLQSIWRDRRGFPVGEITPKEGPPPALRQPAHARRWRKGGSIF